MPERSLDGPLRDDRDFRLFFTARAISVAGSWITYVVLPILLFQRTGSALRPRCSRPSKSFPTSSSASSRAYALVAVGVGTSAIVALFVLPGAEVAGRVSTRLGHKVAPRDAVLDGASDGGRE